MSEPLTPQVEVLIAKHERLATPEAGDPPAATIAMRGNLDVFAALLRTSASLRDAGLDAEDAATVLESAVGGALAMFVLQFNGDPTAALDDLGAFLDHIFAVAADHLQRNAQVIRGRVN